MKIALVLAIVVMASLTTAAQTPSATPAEMDEARQWVAAKFEGIQRAPVSEAWIEVVDNHGPVQANRRGGNPMRIVVAQYVRGLYCHAPSELIIHLPGPGKTFEAVAGVDTNDQTSGGRGSVQFSVRVGEMVSS